MKLPPTAPYLSNDGETGVHCGRLVDVKDKVWILDQTHPESQKQAAGRRMALMTSPLHHSELGITSSLHHVLYLLVFQVCRISGSWMPNSEACMQRILAVY